MEYREIISFSQSLELALKLPGSKSITNRALLCAALALGKSRIYGALKSEDTEVMKAALKVLGIRMTERKDFIEVNGAGGNLKKGRFILNTGNSGIATRFLAALACTRTDVTVIKTHGQMSKRPMTDLVQALQQLGVKIFYHGKRGHTPLEVMPYSHTPLKRIVISGDKSSQYLSALLMIGPCLGYPLRIQVKGRLTSRPYVDVTLAVMESFGVRVQNKAYREFLIQPQRYKTCDYQIEGDATAGTYFSSINYLHGGTLRFENLGLKSIQGDVNYPKALAKLGKGKRDMNAMPDAAMTLATTAPFVRGEITITGLSNLRIKETDRLKALATELKKVGVKATITRNSITVFGLTDSLLPPPQRGPAKRWQANDIMIKTYKDHRMAMSFAVAGTKIPGIVIENPDCVNKTYPNFWKDLELTYLSPIKLGKKNLVLTGMRCSGKNHLGHRIARLLGRPFVDLDAEIEKDQGMLTSEIVRKHGWDYFRKVEQKICSSFQNTQKLIIATGGGVILNPKNMQALKKNGLIVFVFADPRALAERLKKKSNRPALKGKDPLQELEEVWHERRPLYLRYADVVWDNTSGEVIKNNLEQIFRR